MTVYSRRREFSVICAEVGDAQEFTK